MNTTMTTLTFQGTEIKPVIRDSHPWLRLPEIEAALDYKSAGKSLARIFARHADEFTANMTRVLKLTTAGGKQAVRVFSLRGAHLLAMFARTPIAKQFRAWVLDLIEAEIAAPRAKPAPIIMTAPIDDYTLAMMEGVAADAEFISGWWKAFGAAIQILDPSTEVWMREKMVGAAVCGRHLVKKFGLASAREYVANYPWRGTEAQIRAYSDRPLQMAQPETEADALKAIQFAQRGGM